MAGEFGHLFDLHGRIALITGGGGGLGSPMVLGLAEHGADIVCVERTQALADPIIEQVQQMGHRGLAIGCDVRVSTEADAAVQQTLDTFGRIDILVNAAGFGVNFPAETFPDDAWNDQIMLNLSGTFFFCRAASRPMIAKKRGSIINISSIAGAVGLGRGSAAYCATKGAVNNLTHELALEWGPHNVRVNAVMPCQFRTPGNMQFLQHPTYGGEQLMQRWVSNIPLGRLGEPNEIAGPVVFLASDAASMVNGHILAVDGGYLAR